MNLAEVVGLVSGLTILLIFGLAFYSEFSTHLHGFSVSTGGDVVTVSDDLHYSGNNNTFYITSPAESVYISGNHNLAYYRGDVPVYHIFLSGNYNRLVMDYAYFPVEIKVSGNDNVVYVPRSSYVRVVNVGNNCQVIYHS